jgi:anti-anti-sigma regulatory factor
VLPRGVEVRPELQAARGVLAFGFAGERVDGDAAVTLLRGELVDLLTEAAQSSPARLVVIDMQNVRSLSANALAGLLSLRRKLRAAGWRMVLHVTDPVTLEVLSVTHPSPMLEVVRDVAALHDLVGNGTGAPAPAAPETAQPRVEFSAEELAEMAAAGTTLEDAIRLVEQLRE